MSQVNEEYLVGIDPGWKNLGMAIIQETENKFKFKVVHTEVLNPAIDPAVSISYIGDRTSEFGVKSVAIERYAPYNNVFSSESENITMLIGGIRTQMYIAGIDVILIRAIDWKIKLAQLSAKLLGFDNPSSSLDKGFSMAMARFLTEGKYEFKTDHEADAVCLAAYPIFRDYKDRK